MHAKCSGMQNILNGLIKYRSSLRGKLLKQLELIGKSPHPEAIIFTCVDSRIVASRITQANPGDYFMVRNPGNIIPNYNLLTPKMPRAEEAALELACLHNNVDTIVVCGHSDCKAMNLVFENRGNIAVKPDVKDGVLKSWLMANSSKTIQKYFELERSNFKKALTFSIYANEIFEVYIDPDNKFENKDKLSQINTIEQLENLKNYEFLRKQLETKRVKAFALWLDIYTGDVYILNYQEKRFVILDEDSFHKLPLNFC